MFSKLWGKGLLHVDPNHVWVTPTDSGAGETKYNVDTRSELFWQAQGGCIVYQGSDMIYFECSKPAHKWEACPAVN